MGIQIPISQTIDNDEPGILRFGVSRAGEIPAPKKLLHPSFARQISSASLSLAAAFSTRCWPCLREAERIRDIEVVARLSQGFKLIMSYVEVPASVSPA